MLLERVFFDSEGENNRQAYCLMNTLRKLEIVNCYVKLYREGKAY